MSSIFNHRRSEAIVVAALLMLLAPGVAWRAQVTFYLLMFSPIVYTMALLRSDRESNAQKFFVLAVLVVACVNSYKISAGFKQNYRIHRANDIILREVSDRIGKNIDDDDEILLFKAPAPYYAGTMPYDRPLIETWMKQYYSLPESVNFVWK